MTVRFWPSPVDRARTGLDPLRTITIRQHGHSTFEAIAARNRTERATAKLRV